MKYLLLLLLPLALFSCKDKNTYTLSGTADGFADGTEILVYTFEDNQPKVVDTIAIQEGKFSATYPKPTNTTLNFFRPADTNGTILFFPETEDLKVILYKDSIYASTVSGSKENDAYTSFSKRMFSVNQMRQKSQAEYQAAAQAQDQATMDKIQADNELVNQNEAVYKKQFIKDNNNSIFSVMLISEMLGRKELTTAETKEALDGLTPKVAASEIAIELKKAIETMKSADVGNEAPDFSAPTPTGETFSLKEAMGKYTIIDFWASWCKPCRLENPNVVAVYNKYHDKGLNIISVSLDKADMKDKWIQAIADDKMDWYHVSNLQFWQEPIAAQYNVRSIPATFLLDENGVIIAKDLRGPELEAKIASLFPVQ